MAELNDAHRAALADLILSTADDKLMLGHRNSDWTGLAPILEEDIAFSAFAQDDMAHAAALFELAGTLLDCSADQLAFGREPSAYRCAQIVLMDDTFNWATAITRLFLFSEFNLLRYGRMARSSYGPLSELASRLASEQQIVLEHVLDWVGRLGQGTEESRQKMQASIDDLAPHAVRLFEPVEDQDVLESEGLYPTDDECMFDRWVKRIRMTTETAGLTFNPPPFDAEARGGRRGEHDAVLPSVLDEMCEVFRTDPDASW